MLIAILIGTFIFLVEIGINFNSVLIPVLNDTFKYDATVMQMTVSAGTFAVGFSAIILGRLSDIIGRKPCVVAGLSLFVIGTGLGGLADNIYMVFIARILQGLGAGAGWSVGNAALRDIYCEKEFIKVMNSIHAVIGIVPACAPLIGSYIAVYYGWQSCFYLLFFLSIICSFIIYIKMKETVIIDNNKNEKFSFLGIFENCIFILKNKKYFVYCLVKVVSVMLIICEGVNIPLLFVDYMGVEQQYYGLYVIPGFLCYAASSFLGHIITNKYSIDASIKTGLILITVSNGIILLFYNIIGFSPILITLIKVLSYAGWGQIFGNCTGLIVTAVDNKAGSSSALMLSLEMLFSGIGIYLLSIVFNGTILPLTIFLLVFSLAMFFYLSYAKNNIIN